MHPLALGFLSSHGLLEAQDWVQVTLHTISCSTTVEPSCYIQFGCNPVPTQWLSFPFFKEETFPTPALTFSF